MFQWSQDCENSWEYEARLDRPDLIAIYEREIEIRVKQNEAAKSNYSKEPDSIIGCTDNKGFMQFLVKWKGVDEAELIAAKEVKIKFPHIVNEFFKERLNWNQN